MISIRCLNRLYGSHDARDEVAEYPLAGGENARVGQLVGLLRLFRTHLVYYRDLARLGFQTGSPPDRVAEPELFKAFVAELRRCDPLHVDLDYLYVSNIMWRRSDDEQHGVRIRIVDWDALRIAWKRATLFQL